MDMNLSKLWEIVEDRGGWLATVYVLQRVGHDLTTEQQQKGSNALFNVHLCFQTIQSVRAMIVSPVLTPGYSVSDTQWTHIN